MDLARGRYAVAEAYWKSVMTLTRVGSRQLTDGTVADLRTNAENGLLWTFLHGSFRETTFRGHVFIASDTIGTVTPRLNVQGGTATTFALYNPPGSGILLSLIQWNLTVAAPFVAPVVGVYGLYVTETITALPTSTDDPIVITSCFTTDETTPNYGNNPGIALKGVSLPVAQALANVTLADVPILFRPFTNKFTGTVGKLFGNGAFGIVFEGTALLLPGALVTVQQIAADGTNALGWNTVVWEEIPL